MNSRITKRERGLIKGALRRVFARSELRQMIMERIKINHHDAARPRVKKWSLCPICNEKVPTYTVVVDHKIPVIPTDRSFEEMSLDEVVDRLWCEESNLQPICESCHLKKTALEREERKTNKKGRKTNVGSKKAKRPTASSNKRNSSRSVKSRNVSIFKKARG